MLGLELPDVQHPVAHGVQLADHPRVELGAVGEVAWLITCDRPRCAAGATGARRSARKTPGRVCRNAAGGARPASIRDADAVVRPRV